METLHEAVLYSKDNCQWCDRVKQLMNACNFPFVEYKYEKDFTKCANWFIDLGYQFLDTQEFDTSKIQLVMNDFWV